MSYPGYCGYCGRPSSSVDGTCDACDGPVERTEEWEPGVPLHEHPAYRANGEIARRLFDVKGEGFYVPTRRWCPRCDVGWNVNTWGEPEHCFNCGKPGHEGYYGVYLEVA